MDTKHERVTDRAVLTVEGMTCGSCARKVESALVGVPGVTRVVVDQTSGRAYVEGSALFRELTAAVHSAGYSTRVAEEDGQQPTSVASRKGSCC